MKTELEKTSGGTGKNGSGNPPAQVSLWTRQKVPLNKITMYIIIAYSISRHVTTCNINDNKNARKVTKYFIKADLIKKM